MDEEQQIIQEPVQEPAPEKQSDKTQAILTAVSPLVSVFFGGSAGVNIIPPLICWLVWKDANPLVDKVGKNILNAQISWAIYTVAACLSCLILIGFVLAPVVVINSLNTVFPFFSRSTDEKTAGTECRRFFDEGFPFAGGVQMGMSFSLPPYMNVWSRRVT